MKAEYKIIPVSRYITPKYPSRKDVSFSPSILRAVPERWGAKPAVCMALMLTLSTGLCGCRGGADGNPFSRSKQEAAELSVPVFAHGSGTGSYGCVSVAPPVFLSEEEALLVIREEAEARGVHFSDAKSIQGDRFPATNPFDLSGKGSSQTWEGTLKLDGYDPVLDIAFEYISMEDVQSWEKVPSGTWVSVSSYNMKGTAERLAEVVKNTAVFYDPASDFSDFDFNMGNNQKDLDAYRIAYETSQKVRMIEDLRAQVRDFLEWLAAEGII